MKLWPVYLMIACSVLLSACGQKGVSPKTEPQYEVAETTALFDGKSLGQWKIVKEDYFEGAAAVTVADGNIIMAQGLPFTGIRWTGDCPTENYEISYRAKRLVGVDIFGALTAPVGDSHVTFVIGGWGDSVVGLSNVNKLNASENPYTVTRGFDDETWYDIRFRVTREKVLAWINGKQVLKVERKIHTFDLYKAVETLRPLGFFTWRSEGALCDIKLLKLRGK